MSRFPYLYIQYLFNTYYHIYHCITNISLHRDTLSISLMFRASQQIIYDVLITIYNTIISKRPIFYLKLNFRNKCSEYILNMMDCDCYSCTKNILSNKY
jgi:hypothetical protein